MVRLAGVALLLGCLTAFSPAQALKGQTSDNSVRSAPAAGTPASPSIKSAYPLDAFTEFSAVMVGSIMEVGEGTVESHIYRSGNLMRMEGVEGHGYMVTDLSSQETYGVSAGPCMHDTHPYFRASPFAAMRPGSTVQRVAAGKETLDGHSCQIEDITVSPPQVGKPPLKMRFWEAEDLQGFPIRIDFERAGGQRSTVRYKNVVLGPQDRTLFIHPKSCGSLPQRPQAKKQKAGTTKNKKPTTSSPGAAPEN